MDVGLKFFEVPGKGPYATLARCGSGCRARRGTNTGFSFVCKMDGSMYPNGVLVSCAEGRERVLRDAAYLRVADFTVHETPRVSCFSLSRSLSLSLPLSIAYAAMRYLTQRGQTF